jgi:anti-sigma regulatory factor (Ser/Thr protein kinase)
MHSKASIARQAGAGGYARHAEPARWAPAPVVQDNPRTGRARNAVRILPPADAAGNNFGDRWPMHSFLELGAFPSAVPCARLHAREILWEWHLAGLSESTELIVSELVTNAIAISGADDNGAPVRLWLLSDGVCVLIVVWDASPLPPARVDSGENDESGRGLLLVETLSARWNWYSPQHPRDSKVVWALIDDLLQSMRNSVAPIGTG